MSAGRRARVLIVAGEASGDLYGGLLMRAMTGRVAAPEDGTGGVSFTGVGGSSMRASGLEPIGDASVLGVTGLFEVAARFGAIWRAWRSVVAVLESATRKPDLAILIDYPDFNLRVAARAHRAGVPVLYFISPQVWAWRRGRVKRMRSTVDRMLVILPFEEALYREAGVPVSFVGHPLLDLVHPGRSRSQERARLGLDPDRPLVALLPGSRRNEISTLLPPLLEAVAILRSEFRDLQAMLLVAPTTNRAEMEARLRALPKASPPPVLVSDDRYDAVAAADLALVASGTATLETALLGVPMVIVYRMNPLSYALARRLSDLNQIGMPNLIAARPVVPELVQERCRGEVIAAEARAILTDPARMAQMRAGLLEVRGRLGSPGAIGRVARVAWDMIDARETPR
jgi:lipid-A-disaccharide synthase